MPATRWMAWPTASSNPNGAACTALTSKFVLTDVSNPRYQRQRPVPRTTCLSDAQIATVAHLNSRFNLGFTLPGGISSYGVADPGRHDVHRARLRQQAGL